MAQQGFFRRGVGELAIARPDDAKRLIIYKHPDRTIPTKAQLTVEPDECVLLFRDGKFGGIFREPGRYTLTTSNVPFLSDFVDEFTGGNLFVAEAFFVTTREIPDVKFGGMIGALEDPKSGVGVKTRVHGSFALRVVDPERLLIGMVGLGRFDSNEDFLGWFRELVLKVVRERIAELIVEKKMPLLEVTSGAYTSEIEAAVIGSVQPQLDSYGIRVIRLGNFVVGIDPKDEGELKKLYKDAAYVRMAGGMSGFQQFAAGKAMMGAGEGMAMGGDGNGVAAGAALGVGFGIAQSLAGQTAAANVAPAKPAAPTGSKFCSECGSGLKPNARFCSECGSPQGS